MKESVEVILNNLENNPCCPHGPTLLFSKIVKGEKRKFYACAACRDRKQCQFFLWEDERDNISGVKKKHWEQEKKKFLKNIKHRKLFLVLNKVLSLPPEKRLYCNSCSKFHLNKNDLECTDHNVVSNITDYLLSHPSEMLPPRDDTKKEAQFLFSKKCVKELVTILEDLDYKNVVCVGTPRLHEYIRSENTKMNSLLLDIDDRFHNFFGPLEFCWYNSFNHHFFFDDAIKIFHDFLQSNNGKKIALITDPPFGGRTEPLSHTIKLINKEYQKLNGLNDDLPVFWIFPYFMEPQILNDLPNFKMLDYKVDYENHSVFQSGPKGRKQGSPVRIFTNVMPRLIKLSKGEYKYCQLCKKWIAKENKHCYQCNDCTSKDGRTYAHCDICNRCVKPTWKHCTKCNRCTQDKHKCGGYIEFTKECFNCQELGHKKSDCPKLTKNSTSLKRQKKSSYRGSKKPKVSVTT